MEAKNRYIGERYGNLEYHLKVIFKEKKELGKRLSKIKNQELSEAERYRRESEALSDFKSIVYERIDKLDSQIQGIKDHLDGEAVDFAEEICESNMKTFQEDNKVEHEVGFSTASEK